MIRFQLAAPLLSPYRRITGSCIPSLEIFLQNHLTHCECLQGGEEERGKGGLLGRVLSRRLGVCAALTIKTGDEVGGSGCSANCGGFYLPVSLVRPGIHNCLLPADRWG